LGFQSWVTALLLLLYIGGTIGSDLEQVLHAHTDVESHSVQNEQNACHRTIYHHEKENGCQHNAHFVKTEKCKNCHSVFQADGAFVITSSFKFPVHNSPIEIKSIPVVIYGIQLRQSLRGPPFA